MATKKHKSAKPRQRASYQQSLDGSEVIRPVPPLDELFGSVKLGRPVGSIREEKKAACGAIASAASRKESK